MARSDRRVSGIHSVQSKVTEWIPVLASLRSDFDRDDARRPGAAKAQASARLPLTFALKFEKNSPASFFEVEVMRREPSWAILPPTSALAA
jgi:hypothetical protein